MVSGLAQLTSRLPHRNTRGHSEIHPDLVGDIAYLTRKHLSGEATVYGNGELESCPVSSVAVLLHELLLGCRGSLRL